MLSIHFLFPHWIEVTGRDAIQRKFHFKDFKEAWSWMSKVAEIADQEFFFFQFL